MKKIYNVVFALLIFPFVVQAQGINFEKATFKEALALAKKQNKLLFLDGGAVWCAPCKAMEKTVFHEAEVGTYFAANLVSFKVDVERGEGPALKKKYEIQSLPGYVILDGEGNVVSRFGGLMSTEDFMSKVKSAVVDKNDPNSLGRLEAKYTLKKNDPTYLATYLDKLYEAKEPHYADVLEQYLKVQTTIAPQSKEMVLLLAKHNKQIVLGGKAYQIYKENFGCDEWKKYVRKDIRETYLKLPKQVIDNTTEYAIQKKDTAIMKQSLEAFKAYNGKVSQKQIDQAYTYFYLKTGDGENYKKLVHDDIQNYINKIDVNNLRSFYEKWLKDKAAGDPDALRLHPNSERTSSEILQMVKNYAQFVSTDKEKKEVLAWMKVAYDIIPGDPRIASNYAKLMYMFGDKNEAITIQKEAVASAANDEKRGPGYQADLELMQQGKTVYLN